jgi:hypothetical protein
MEWRWARQASALTMIHLFHATRQKSLRIQPSLLQQFLPSSHARCISARIAALLISKELRVYFRFCSRSLSSLFLPLPQLTASPHDSTSPPFIFNGYFNQSGVVGTFNVGRRSSKLLFLSSVVSGGFQFSCIRKHPSLPPTQSRLLRTLSLPARHCKILHSVPPL